MAEGLVRLGHLLGCVCCLAIPPGVGAGEHGAQFPLQVGEGGARRV